MKQLYLVLGLVLSVLLVGCVGSEMIIEDKSHISTENGNYSQNTQKGDNIQNPENNAKHELKIDLYNAHDYPVAFTINVGEELLGTIVLPSRSSIIKVFILSEESPKINVTVQDLNGNELDYSSYYLPNGYFQSIAIYYENYTVEILEITEF